jgi:hypothetical protein
VAESGKADARAARKARLDAALRENLKRRKAQARARSARSARTDEAAESAAVERGRSATGGAKTG